MRVKQKQIEYLHDRITHLEGSLQTGWVMSGVIGAQRPDTWDDGLPTIADRLARLEDGFGAPMASGAEARLVNLEDRVAKHIKQIRDTDQQLSQWAVRMETLSSAPVPAPPTSDVAGACRGKGPAYTPAQIGLAAERFVDVFAEFTRDALDGQGERYSGHFVAWPPGSRDYRHPRAGTVGEAFDALVRVLANDSGIDWPTCEAWRAATGRGVPLFDPPTKERAE